tara:strand:- start:566 stop:1246 length:681 start_codon:yes stop_codon:yes gene_type:complete
MSIITITRELRKLALDCTAYTETGLKKEKMFGLYKSVPPSGYSVGPIQFDISHNRQGREMLLECGVSQEDLDVLLQKPDPSDIPDLLHKINNLLMLPESQEIVLEESQAYVDKGLHRIDNLSGIGHMFPFSTSEILLMIDYHTQFHISIGGKLHTAMQGTLDFTPEWFFEFKQSTKWYRRKDGIGKRDTMRRWNCVRKFCELRNIPFTDTEKPVSDYGDIPEWLRT